VNQYQQLEKILDSKKCPDCGKTLRILDNQAQCKCGFCQELINRDSKRNRNGKNRVQYLKLEEFLPIEKD
jgi:predicted nucleic acid-binding Zn ribbon protein